MYKSIFRPLLYQMSPERAHYFTAGLLNFAAQASVLRNKVREAFEVKDARLEREVFGLKFPNPVGLAAGFDKDARWIEALELLGFGFIEVGTVTPRPQPGNDKPRLFRLVEDEAIINRMGFNNAGMDAMADNIAFTKHSVPLGGNIGKNKTTPNDEAALDYLQCFAKLYPLVNYFVVNVSSPNTPGLRALQDKDELKKLFDLLFEYRVKQKQCKPVLLKIAPDLNEEQLNDIIALVTEMKIDGVVATNTTLNRQGLRSKKTLTDENGGLSGKPVRARSTEVVRYLHQQSGGAFPIVGVGGIHSPEDALEKLEAGASLVQVYTGFIYEGPSLVKRINQRLLQK